MAQRYFGILIGLAMCSGPFPATVTRAEPEPSITDKAAARFDAFVHDRAQLRLFLKAMPKGGDLHNHLWGAPYAEDFLAWASADGQCVTKRGQA